MASQTEPVLRGGKSIAHLLHEHKQVGCNVLVAGDVPDTILDTVSAKLLGDPSERTRKRIFGLFDRNEQTVRDRLDQGGYGRSPTRVVTSGNFARSDCGAISADSDLPTAGPYHRDYSIERCHVDSEDLTAVRSSLVDQFDTATDSYAISELRVCIDSLRPVLDKYSEETVATFLTDLTSEIKARNGMGHFVLPASVGSDAVESVRQHFDIIMPLRPRNGTAEQKWIIPARNDDDECGRESDWMEL